MTSLLGPTTRAGFAEALLEPTPRWPAGLSVRPRGADDIDGLSGLFLQADFQRNASTLDPFERPDDARALVERAGPGVFEMVAVMSRHGRPCADRAVDGDDTSAARIVGYAGLYAFTGRQRHVGSCTLAVHERYQRQGVGTALLQVLLRVAYDYVGLERVQLTVFADNSRAISLYRRVGFRTEGRLAGFARREDGLIDALLLAHHAFEGRAARAP